MQLQLLFNIWLSQVGVAVAVLLVDTLAVAVGVLVVIALLSQESLLVAVALLHSSQHNYL